MTDLSCDVLTLQYLHDPLSFVNCVQHDRQKPESQACHIYLSYCVSYSVVFQ